MEKQESSNLFTRLEKIGEIARLMKIPPGRFGQMKAADEPGINAPIPHYPNWMYCCPKCKQPWESPLYREAWLVLCPGCRSE